MQIGPYRLENPVLLAPMAGVTDLPFRRLCRRFGAALAISEMVTADSALWASPKSARRLDFSDEPGPVAVQLLGTDPLKLAEAARRCVDRGAGIIDINMGCPAKKVCNVAAGSALLKDEKRVGEILRAVVQAVDVPVTLKTRTGWDRDHRNAVEVARIAEDSGIQALALHGRTRADAYRGEAEYDTIAEVKSRIGIPVIANGDIRTPEKAKFVLDHTGADAIMIGRAAQGRPWIFREIDHYLNTGERLPEPAVEEIRSIMLDHLHNLYEFYGEFTGVRVARKHISWYSKGQPGGAVFRDRVNRVETRQEQLELTHAFFERLVEEKRAA